MTLYRQLLIFTSILFIILFSATWFTEFQSTRKYLEEQLESHAQDTATSLGLSITSNLATDDLATVDTMLNVVFDRGYYRTILLTDLDNNTLLERTNSLEITDIPQWFIKAVPLKSPGAKSSISSGWMKKGYLYVESHPGYAYSSLWNSTVTMTTVFLMVGISVLLIGALVLRVLLSPLKKVELQAENLCKREYILQEKLPRTRELRSVVTAMNSMTEKVKQMFDEQASVADTFRKSAYSDPVTGFGNRRFLESQVNSAMEQKDTPVHGAFILLEIQSLQQVNLDKGYDYTDTLLSKIANEIDSEINRSPGNVLARLSGGNFGLFCNLATYETAAETCERTIKRINKVADAEGLPLPLACMGGTLYTAATSLGHLLAEADEALRSVQLTSSQYWEIVSAPGTEDKPSPGKMEWLAQIDTALSAKKFLLYGQPIFSKTDLTKTIQIEIFSRIKDESGEEIHAGQFIPIAEQIGRITDIDKIIIEKALQLTPEDLDSDTIVVNVSAISIQDSAFIDWIVSNLKGAPSSSPTLIFEISEFDASQNLEHLLNFSRLVKDIGHFIGLDHFGKSFSNFGYLKSLQPKYVKIDRAFTHELKSKQSDSHFFVSSLSSVAHSLDIEVIVEGIEDAEQLDAVRSLNVDGVQGYHLRVPRLLG